MWGVLKVIGIIIVVVVAIFTIFDLVTGCWRNVPISLVMAAPAP